jgi:hypothetical protein
VALAQTAPVLSAIRAPLKMWSGRKARMIGAGQMSQVRTSRAQHRTVRGLPGLVSGRHFITNRRRGVFGPKGSVQELTHALVRDTQNGGNVDAGEAGIV